jgi:DNA invertase Pin-like site-specific DNA recombinase
MLVGYMRVSSDAKDDRPGLTQALSFVRAGDVLVVWKLDRLGRSLPHLLCIVNTLKEKQVAFRSLTEGMDTTTASGELLFHVFGALAQYERAMTKERVVCRTGCRPAPRASRGAPSRHYWREAGRNYRCAARRHVQSGRVPQLRR